MTGAVLVAGGAGYVGAHACKARARAAFGFAPVQSDLASIVRTAWAWHQRAHPRRND